jgi:hypothetical protein
LPTIRRCGCATRASIKLSINRIRASCGPRGWRRTAAHLYASVGNTAAHSSIRIAAGRGLSSRCSPSTTGLSSGHRDGAPPRHTDKLGAPVYLCDSRSPWQRGTNENTNGLLRDDFPKGVTLIDHPPAHLLAVEHELNHRPRVILGDRCPADVFAALLASNGPSVLRR